jgi:hypothetical protein
VFRERVWMPPSEPIHASAQEFLRVAGKGNKWRGGLPLRHRTKIVADDCHRLARMMADVLVTHEAPDPQPQGNEAVDLLAVTMGASKVYHGHAHDNFPYNNAAVQIFRGCCCLPGGGAYAAATADSTLAKIERLCKLVNRGQH